MPSSKGKPRPDRKRGRPGRPHSTSLLSLLQGQGRHGRLQGPRRAAPLRERAREDQVAPRDRHLPPSPAPGRRGRQARPRDGAAALRDHRSRAARRRRPRPAPLGPRGQRGVRLGRRVASTSLVSIAGSSPPRRWRGRGLHRACDPRSDGGRPRAATQLDARGGRLARAQPAAPRADLHRDARPSALVGRAARRGRAPRARPSAGAAGRRPAGHPRRWSVPAAGRRRVHCPLAQRLGDRRPRGRVVVRLRRGGGGAGRRHRPHARIDTAISARRPGDRALAAVRRPHAAGRAPARSRSCYPWHGRRPAPAPRCSPAWDSRRPVLRP